MHVTASDYIIDVYVCPQWVDCTCRDSKWTFSGGTARTLSGGCCFFLGLWYKSVSRDCHSRTPVVVGYHDRRVVPAGVLYCVCSSKALFSPIDTVNLLYMLVILLIILKCPASCRRRVNIGRLPLTSAETK